VGVWAYASPVGSGDGRLPTGVVTFLLTDIVSSTSLWEREPVAMASALEEHDSLIRAAVVSAGGTLLKARGEGDSTFSVFDRPTEAVAAALDARRRLEAHSWPDGCALADRFAIHAGEVAEREGDYLGTAVNRAARLRDLAVGGQVLVSEAVAVVVVDQLPEHAVLVDVGTHELRGLSRPERVAALVDARRPRREAIGGVCPYRGLLAFQPEDQDVFFGREELVAGLISRLVDRQFVPVVGASGSGKSSLVRAGIVAALQNGAVPGSDEWPVTILTPGTDPVARLADTWTPGERQVLVIDQMEELFTSCRDDGVRAAFVDVVLDELDRGDGSTLVVTALRADFYGHCASLPRLAEALTDTTILLGPMSAAELRRAIEGPAEVTGHRLDAGLVDLILRDLAHEPGALPLLSHALMETWHRRTGRTMTIDGYEESGGVRGAIARTAESVWNERLDDGQRDSARRIFLRLTELGEGTEDTRRRVQRSELVADGEGGETAALLGVLADARLLTMHEDTVEVAHEALIREWPRLRRWLDDDREALRLHRHLTHAAEDWAARGRDPSELYRGPRLVAARELLTGELNPLEGEFLAASAAAEDAEREEAEAQAAARERAHRRLRGLVVGLGVVLVAAVVAGVVAVVQRDRANDQADRAQQATVSAQVDRIVAEIPQLVARDRVLAGLLAVEAERLRPSASTRAALLRTVTDEPRLRATFYGGRTGYLDVAAYPDGRRVVAVGPEGLDLWDTDAGELVATADFPDPSGVVEVSDDGALVATGGADGTLRFWAGDTLQRDGASIEFDDRIRDVAFFDDGRRAAVALGRLASSDPITTASTPRIIDVVERTETAVTLPGHELTVNAVAVSPGGLLATGGNDRRIVFHDTAGRIVGDPLPFFSSVFSLDFSPDGELLVAGAFNAGDGDRIATVFDAASGEVVVDLTGTEGLADARFNRDGSRVVVASGTVQEWQVGSWEAVGGPIETQHGPAHAVSGAEHDLVVTGVDGTVSTFETGGSSSSLGRLVPGAPSSGGVFHPEGSTFVIASVDDTAHVYERETLEPVTTLSVGDAGDRPPLAGSTPVAFNPDGDVLALGNRSGEVRFFDTRSYAPLGPAIDVGTLPIVGLVFSPDGSQVVVTHNVAADQGAYTVDVERGTVTGLRSAVPFALGATFTPDGDRLVVTSAAGFAVLFPVEDGAIGRAEGAIDAVSGIASTASFTPDGDRLIVATLDGTLEVLDGKTLEPIQDPITASDTSVASIEISPDGELAVVQDLDTNVHLVELRGSGSLSGSFPGAGSFGLPGFDPDGEVVLLPGPNGTVVFDLDVDAWQRTACDRAGRLLTEEEWDRYLSSAGRYEPTCR
jgi:WD40 repeat protein/class 3 adenylate cyclase